MLYQNLCDTQLNHTYVNFFIDFNIIIKQDRLKIKDLNFHFMKSEKEQ